MKTIDYHTNKEINYHPSKEKEYTPLRRFYAWTGCIHIIGWIVLIGYYIITL